MMRNLTDEKGDPHPLRLKGKVMHLIDINTISAWMTDYKQFSNETPTIIGSNTLPGALQIPKLPERGTGESEEQYAIRAMRQWKKIAKTHPKYWNPWTDSNKNFVIGHEYTLRHKEAIRALANMEVFDGTSPDEIHKMLRKNQISTFIEEIRPKMKMFLGLTGTPVNNQLDIIPQMMRLLSAGKIDLGTVEEFKQNWLIPSQVQRAFGARNPARTDINPARAGELAALMQPYIDVKHTHDVKGKTMPVMFIDESQPAHMTGQQAKLYRLADAKATHAERQAVKAGAELGVEEAAAFTTEEARARVAVARALSNCPAYKMPDSREFAAYEAEVVQKHRGKVVGTTKESREFRLPSYDTMVGNKRNQWDGKWPSAVDVEAKRINKGYLDALNGLFDHVMGVSYDTVEGKPIDKKMLAAIKKGKWESPTGQEWLKSGGKVVNHEYGPEGMICRGKLDEKTGEVLPLTTTYHNPLTKQTEEIEIPVGLKFPRDPNQKTKGFYYIEDDWDNTKKFEAGDDKVEDVQTTETEEEDVDIDDEDILAEFDEDDRADIQNELDNIGMGASAEARRESKKELTKRTQKKKAPTRQKAKGQGPKPGRENLSVTRSTERRRERTIFDAVVTQGNAKCDQLEQNLRNGLNRVSGTIDGVRTPIFGNLIGASCRTVEAKLRTMGMQDVNEALGHSDVSSAEDKARKPRKYFVTYMGKGATLGSRDMNSEIFRRKLDKTGKDTGVSMFVWRTLNGSVGKPPKIGEIVEGWARKERDIIKSTVQDGYGRKKQRSEKVRGLEVPMRVKGVEGPPDTNGNPTVVMNYVYESELKPQERARIKALEIFSRSARGTKLAEYEGEIAKVLSKHWTDHQPLTHGEGSTPDQHYIFNNCDFLVASDAAQMGINWPGNELHMYDSLYSPMDEQQRMARAARLLPPIIPEELKPAMAEVAKYVEKASKRLKTDPMHHTEDVALAMMQDAIDSLNAAHKRTLLESLPGSAPDQVIEMHYAQKAFDKIAIAKPGVEERLRRHGYVPDPTRPAEPPGNFVPPEAITNADIMNTIIREELTPLEIQMMRSRKALVHVKRYMTSADVPILVPAEQT
ncbi:MAG: DEAD/DEAH box helicase, partial [candidate division Zixibacteria bacterium]